MTEDNSLNDIIEESSALSETNKQGSDQKEINYDTFRSKNSKQRESDIENITPPFHNEEIIRKSGSKAGDVTIIDQSIQASPE